MQVIQDLLFVVVLNAMVPLSESFVRFMMTSSSTVVVQFVCFLGVTTLW